MFDVGDLPVGLLAFGNCVSLFKTGVTKWPLKLHVRFLTFYVFFKIQKTRLYVFLSCCTRSFEHWLRRSLLAPVVLDPGDDDAAVVAAAVAMTSLLS